MTKKPTKPGAGRRRVLKTRVKKKSGLKESSRRWLERHLNDPYVQRSKADGYRSRAAYKLIEIDDRYHLLKPGRHVIDLGAAPGGWCQVAAERTRSTAASAAGRRHRLSRMDPLPGATVLELDFLDADAPAGCSRRARRRARRGALRHGGADHRPPPHRPSSAPCICAKSAADFALSVLKPGGHFLAKAFQGGTEDDLLDLLKRSFRSRPPRQAAGLARRVGRALSAGQGFQGRAVTTGRGSLIAERGAPFP